MEIIWQWNILCFVIVEQTAGGKGCTKWGYAVRLQEVALQDLFIYQIKGISCYARNS